MKENNFSNYQDRRCNDCIEEIKKNMRKCLSKSENGNNYYEFRISEGVLNRIMIPLLKLYQDAFAQGVYTAK